MGTRQAIAWQPVLAGVLSAALTCGGGNLGCEPTVGACYTLCTSQSSGYQPSDCDVAQSESECSSKSLSYCSTRGGSVSASRFVSGCRSCDGRCQPSLSATGGNGVPGPFEESQLCGNQDVECNDGPNPPQVEGTYCGTATVTASTSSYWDIGDDFALKVTLDNQTSDNRIEGTLSLGLLGTITSTGSFVRGEGNDFTVYMESDWAASQSCQVHVLAVVTGSASSRSAPSKLNGKAKWLFTSVTGSCPSSASASVNKGALVEYALNRNCNAGAGGSAGKGGAGGSASCSCDVFPGSCDPGCACDSKCSKAGSGGSGDQAGSGGGAGGTGGGTHLCGNGVLEGNELCDKTDYGGATCADLGYLDGNLHCGADCTLDTSDCKSSVQFLQGLVNAMSLLVDSTYLYWIDLGAAGRPIVRASKAGGGTEILASTGIQPKLVTPYGKLMSMSGGRVYWVEPSGGSAVVKSMALSGGAVTTIVGSVENTAPEFTPSGAIAIAAGRIFLGEDTDTKTQPGRILAVDISTGTVSVYVSAILDDTDIGHIATDSSSLYWTERLFSTAHIVKRTINNGTNTNLCGGEGRDLVPRGAYLYYRCTEAEVDLCRVSVLGGSSTVLYPTSSAISGLDVDSTHIYWVHGGLNRGPLGGGSYEVVGQCPSGSGDLVVDATQVFFSCNKSIYKYLKK